MNNLKFIPLDQRHQEIIMANAKTQAEPYIQFMTKLANESAIKGFMDETGKVTIEFSYESDPRYIQARAYVEEIMNAAQAKINKGR